jgi:hypothetical protein
MINDDVQNTLGAFRIWGCYKREYHDNCTLCRALCPVPMSSDFIADQATKESPLCHLYTSFDLWPRDHYKTFHDFLQLVHSY